MCSFIKKRVGLFKNQKGFKWGFWNQRGFSLVELMVVVAIIGILASIAIPNYQRFQRKARQSEPKATLGGMFTAQKVFNTEWGFGTSDLSQMGFDLESGANPVYNTGWTDGEASGDWNAADDGNAKYAQYRGPRAPATAKANTKETVAAASQEIDLSTFPGGACSCTNATIGCSGAACTCGSGCVLDTTTLNSCTTVPTGFNGNCGSFSPGLGGDAVPGNGTSSSFNNITFTIGSIGNIGGGTSDAWTITDKKVLTNVQNGL